jgi:hypothetical protein
MKLRRTTAACLAAAVALCCGCATLGAAGDVEHGAEETTTTHHARKPANEAASLAPTDDEASQDEDRDRSSDRDGDPAESARARRSAARDNRKDDEAPLAGSMKTAAKRAATEDEDERESVDAAFEDVIADARRSGGLTASDEAVFRRDLAAMPPALRPQMAQMLLAMRNRSAPPSTAAPRDAGSPRARSQPVEGDFAMERRGVAVRPVGTTSVGGLAKQAVAERSTLATSALADNNPLRALTDSSANNELLTAAIAAQQRSAAHAATPSNAPAEVGGRLANRDADNDVDLRSRKSESIGEMEAETAPAPGESTAKPNPSPVASTEAWRVMLAATIRTLEDDLAKSAEKGSSSANDAAQRQAFLRMLYLIANRRDDALQPVTGADAREQKFWIDWLYGTSVYLDVNTTASDGQRATAAASRLREAVQRLGEQANLEISNLAFCRRVTSFGVYEPFTASEKPAANDKSPARSIAHPAFAPNQEVLLYAEIRNFTSKPGPKGYHTLLRPSYQIFDSQGRRIGSVVELDESHDYCQQRRTDFFVCYHIYLPTRIDPGDYKLKLTIEDAQAGKVRESSIDFAIRRP